MSQPLNGQANEQALQADEITQLCKGCGKEVLVECGQLCVGCELYGPPREEPTPATDRIDWFGDGDA